jgi:hypothetical protein
MCLTLESNDLQTIEWWVDAFFAVHEDMHSHTGGTMTLGKGSVCLNSARQKLNTKSSTKAELVGVDDMMPMVPWTRQFMEGQGCDIKKMLCARTTRARCHQRTMDSNPAPNEPGIWMSAVSL